MTYLSRIYDKVREDCIEQPENFFIDMRIVELGANLYDPTRQCHLTTDINRSAANFFQPKTDMWKITQLIGLDHTDFDEPLYTPTVAEDLHDVLIEKPCRYGTFVMKTLTNDQTPMTWVKSLPITKVTNDKSLIFQTRYGLFLQAMIQCILLGQKHLITMQTTFVAYYKTLGFFPRKESVGDWDKLASHYAHDLTNSTHKIPDYTVLLNETERSALTLLLKTVCPCRAITKDDRGLLLLETDYYDAFKAHIIHHAYVINCIAFACHQNYIDNYPFMEDIMSPDGHYIKAIEVIDDFTKALS
jgi:hypothetical protein